MFADIINQIPYMKKKYFSVLAAFMFSGMYAQNFYVVNQVDFENLLYIKEVNPVTGAILNTHFFNSFSNNYGPESLSYRSSTHEIIGKISYYTSNTFIKYNILTNAETLLPVPVATELGESIIVNDRLFVVEDTHFEVAAPKIHEIDLNDGSIISTHDFTYGGDYSPLSMSFMPSTNTIFGIIPWENANRITKYNITTNTQSLLTIAGTLEDYSNLIVAENRLFVTQRTSNEDGSLHDFFIKEINPDTGEIISSTELNFESSDNLQSLTFIPSSHEIVGRIPFNDDEKLLKFNILTNTQSIITIAATNQGFSDIISTEAGSIAGLENFDPARNKGKVIRAYNFIGQEINIATYNQPVILEYENGAREKVIQVSHN